MPNTIVLKGDLGHTYCEGRVASAVTIKPGMLIQADNAGKFKPHATAGGYAENAFAIEDALQGKTITDSYAAGDLVRYFIGTAGDEVYAILKQGQTAATDSLLTSNGDGTLKVASSTDQRLFRCVEALDLSAAGSDGFVKVRILH